MDYGMIVLIAYTIISVMFGSYYVNKHHKDDGFFKWMINFSYGTICWFVLLIKSIIK